MKNREQFGVLVLALFVSLGAVAVAYFTSRSSTETTLVAVTQKDAAPRPTEDSDGDGLPNWKETLYGTDPHNPDSDGDGVSDGDEANKDTNPLKAGDENEEVPYVSTRGLSSTEALARELFAGYTSYRNASGTSLSESDATAVASAAVSGVSTNDTTEPAPFTLVGLSIEDDVSVVAYENAVTAALREASSVREYELYVFARAVSEKSLTELKKLSATADVYDGIVAALAAVEVPKSVASEHVALLNELSSFSRSVRALGAWSGDPLDALTLLNDFSSKEQRMTDAVANVYAFVHTLKKQL